MFRVQTSRDAVLAAGADATRYLQSQLSQDLTPLADGDSAWSFVLTPTGKVESLLRVHRVAADRYRLDTDAGHGAALLARLRRFLIRVDVVLEAEQCSVVSCRGAGLPDAPAGSLVGWGGGFDLPVGHPALDEPSGSVAAVSAGTLDDLERARVESGWPAMGTEILPGETVPAETGIVHAAVSFTKGCYPGQELVERMDSRGASAPWRLEVVDVAEGATPGDEVQRDGNAVGALTSVSGTRAIARVRRNA